VFAVTFTDVSWCNDDGCCWLHVLMDCECWLVSLNACLQSVAANHAVLLLLVDPVTWCLCLPIMRLHCAETAERIDVLFRLETLGDPRYIVLDADLDPPTKWRKILPIGK